MIKKIIIFIVIIGVVALAAKKLIAQKEKVATAPTPLMLNYTIATTTSQDALVHKKHPFLAKVESDKEINIATKLSGTIEHIYVSESQVVKKGEVLVKIDDTVLRTNLKTLQETLKVQKQDVAYYESIAKRNKKLFEANAISKEKYDASVLLVANKKSQVNATKDKIKAIRSDLKYLTIKAPFDGVVSAVLLDEGDLAVTAKPIVKINSFAKKMQFLYAGDKNDIKIGDKVLYHNQMIGRVSKIYPNTRNNLNVAEIALDKPIESKNDSYISVDVVTQTKEGCSVPLNALLHTQENTFVLAFKNDQFVKQEVNVVLEDEERAIIEPCVKERIALASESKLAILPFYKNITLAGKEDE